VLLVRHVALEHVGPPVLEEDERGDDLDLELFRQLPTLVRQPDLFENISRVTNLD
jgi:hypothetical protein